MTKKAQQRRARLIHNGKPVHVRCYDQGVNKCADHYTVCFVGRYPKDGREFMYLAMSEHPFHPQGFGQHGWTTGASADALNGRWAPRIGRRCHLGVRIPFDDLPTDCKALVLREYKALWRIE